MIAPSENCAFVSKDRFVPDQIGILLPEGGVGGSGCQGALYAPGALQTPQAVHSSTGRLPASLHVVLLSYVY